MFTSLQRTQQTLSGSKEPPKKSLDLSVRYCLRDIESLFRFCSGPLVASAMQDRPKGQKESKLLKHPGSQSNFNIGSLTVFFPFKPMEKQGKENRHYAFRVVFSCLDLTVSAKHERHKNAGAGTIETNYQCFRC